jgi:cytochrome c peroxidase
MRIGLCAFGLLLLAPLLLLGFAVAPSAWAEKPKPPPDSSGETDGNNDESELDADLHALLDEHGFTGRIEETLEDRLGRKLDNRLAELGRDLFFDPILALRGDNSCAGCHAPQFGFGDSQSIAIGILNNGVVGPNRGGPRNQRRSPMLLNTAFFPALMWNGRFSAASGDPFDNSEGSVFPAPEGLTRFPPGDPKTPHLLVAQAHIPPTELVEVTGFKGTAGTVDPIFDQFDDGVGIPVPAPDADGNRNEPIRDRLLVELNATKEYVKRFGNVYPSVKQGDPISFDMVGAAIAEFEFSLTFADAPIDRFARGHEQAMGKAEKRGAILFFDKAGCAKCHAVAGEANEMFSDFQNHNIGVPQIAPKFGKTTGNVVFDGPDADEDFGLAQITGEAEDRYKFRTSPLRNVALQPTFFHNGAFTRLEDAVRHHLDVLVSATVYDPDDAGVATDLAPSTLPVLDLLETLDPKLAEPIGLSADEFADLVAFLRTGLLDERLTPKNLRDLIPNGVPSGQPLPFFE